MSNKVFVNWGFICCVKLVVGENETYEWIPGLLCKHVNKQGLWCTLDIKKKKKCCGGELQTTGVTLAYWLSAPSTPTPTSTPPQPQQPPLTHPPSYPYTTHISNYGLNTWMLKIKIFVGWSKNTKGTYLSEATHQLWAKQWIKGKTKTSVCGTLNNR